MGVIASRHNNKQDDDGSSSKQKQHRFAATRRRSSSSASNSSIIRRSSKINNSNIKMSSLNRSKNAPALKSDSTHQATLVSGEDVAMKSSGKRIPMENITNDDDVMVEAEELPKTRKDKSSRGRKTVLSPNKGNSSINNNLPSFLRGGASKGISKKEETAPSSKKAIDPPGALWNPNPSGSMYGMDASFQPGGFSMPLWQPPHHEDSNGGRSWAVPPFLAPLAATVRHPFSHFVPN